MSRFRLIFILFVFISACKPAKTDLVYTTTYSQIKDEKEDSHINEMIAPYKASLDSEMNKVIGFSEVEMPKVKDQPETILGNFIADLVLEFARSVNNETHFSVLNNGGLRASLPKGNISIENVFEVMPFDNELVIVTMNGNDVNLLLGYIAERGGVPVSGMKMKLEKMNGTIVPIETMIGNEKFSVEKTYHIVTSDYLSGGGDNMTFWSKGTIKSTGKKIRDAIIDFIRLKTAENKKLNPKLDSRITILN